MKISTIAALISCLLYAIIFISCQKEPVTTEGPSLVFRFKFDSTQERLGNLGQPEQVAAGNAAQNPVFNIMSAHYLELAPTALTALGAGAVLYRAPETSAGGSNAIDFDKAPFTGNGETFYSVPLKNINPGIYEWLRLSLAYQNYKIKYYVDTLIEGVTIQQEFPGTIASFIGFNTYINTYTIISQSYTVNANRKQGFWAFESAVNYNGINYPFMTSGQAPEGATTVVNPLFATSPVPPGSCVVTANFPTTGLVITGKETNDIIVEVSLSTNKSFEWTEVINDGKWSPSKGEEVVDMGIRGMKLNLR